MQKITSAHILITLDCNFRCDYCFVSHRPRYMTEHTLKKTLDYLIDPAICDKTLRLEFFGGEPTMSIDLILKYLPYIRELAQKNSVNVMVGLVSNMALMTSDILDQLKDAKVNILASYDGKYTHNITRHPGTADLVANNIKLALSKGLSCMVAMQVVPGHLRELYGNFRSIHDLGVKVVAFNPVVHGNSDRRYNDEDWSEMDRQFGAISDFLFQEKMTKSQPFQWSQMDNQLNAIKQVAETGKHNHNGDWSCGACKGSIAIDPEGYIVPCHQMASDWGYDQWNLGHISMRGCMNTSVREEFRKTKFENCSECAVLSCAPCRTINKSTTGSEFELSPQMCQYQRLLFTHAVKLHNRLTDAGYYRLKGGQQSSCSVPKHNCSKEKNIIPFPAGGS